MTPTGLHIAKGLWLPPDYVTKTGAIIAKRRVGKTYTGSVLAEEFCRLGIPWYALDPTGAWWGLRSSADGLKPGLPVIVLGGQHGDIPINEHDGKAIADLLVDEPSYYVVDLSDIDESHAATVRFATAFFTRLYARKNKKREPLHGFWDEGDLFAPQRPGPAEMTMLGAAESIVRRGGLRGMGTTVITQRGAVTNKNVLTQLDILFILRTVSPQDQDAVEDYIKRNAVGEERAEIMGSMASLELGECWVYGPGEEPPLLQRVKIRERRTFNSSATPKMGEKRLEPAKLADVDLEQLRERFAAQVEKAQHEDPAFLQKRIRDLEKDLKIAHDGAAEELARQVAELTPEPTEIEVEVPALPAGLQSTLSEARSLLAPALSRLDALQEELKGIAKDGFPTQTARPAEPVARNRDGARPAPSPPTRQAASSAPRPAVQSTSQNGDEPTLKAGARRILDELATVHPLRLTRSQIGLAVGMKITGGTFNTYWSTLKRAGYLEEAGGDVGITEEGLERAGVVPSRTPRTSEEMIEMWGSKLKKGARDMLNILAEVYPNSLSREVLGEQLDMVSTGGTFNTYLSTLRRNGLAENVDGTDVRAHPNLFVGA